MKTQELYKNLQHALQKFRETESFPETEPMKESTIQRFEYTFELSWKLMSSILKDQGVEAYGIKNILRSAAQMSLIDDVSLWFTFAKARNESSHIYHQEIADAVYATSQAGFADQVELLLGRAERYAVQMG